jgi:diacylglycerol kinase
MKRVYVSFLFALEGLQYAFKRERNFRIEILLGILVIVLGYCFSITALHWLFIVLNIGFVLSAELFNTAMERICDAITTEINPLIKIVKDTAAAAVVVSALCALVSAIIIFYHYF